MEELREEPERRVEGRGAECRLYGPESVSSARARWGGVKRFFEKKPALYILFVDEKKFLCGRDKRKKKKKSVVVLG